MAFFSGPIDNGFLTINNDGSFSLDGHLQLGPTPPDPPVPPTPGIDQINLAAATITAGSPDVRDWPIGAHLSSVYIDPTDHPVEGRGADMNVAFSKMNGDNRWPIIMGPEGEIQYTLWVGCQILGIWYFAGAILCISRGVGDNYVPTGPTLAPGQLPNNWYYYAGSPLAGYQPARGEQVAWFLTSGAQRRNDIHSTDPLVMERTQVVLTSFNPGTYNF